MNDSKSSAADVSAADQRLIDQYTELVTLSGALAHEIKNPLSTIRLNMELLAEDLTDSVSPRERRARNKIALVQRECQRLQNLLDDFLNFAKLRRLNLEPGDLNAVVQRVLEFFAPQAAEQQIEVIRYLDPDLPSVLLDKETLHGALLNFVLNAQQAMQGGGQLLVRTHAVTGGVVLDLIDTGCGMDEKTAAKIFQAFYSTKPGGSGLGLPTALKIIEAHNGRISVESEVDRGTKFTIFLPTPPRIGEVRAEERGGGRGAGGE